MSDRTQLLLDMADEIIAQANERDRLRNAILALDLKPRRSAFAYRHLEGCRALGYDPIKVQHNDTTASANVNGYRCDCGIPELRELAEKGDRTT